MNKKSIFCLSLLMILLLSPQVFAATQENEGEAAGNTLTVDGTLPLNLNFSPSVAGQYVTEATSGNEQWFAVATYHSGGSLFYGSGSDQTSVFKRSRSTSQTFSDASVPPAPVLDAAGNPAPWVTPVADGEAPVVDDWYR